MLLGSGMLSRRGRLACRLRIAGPSSALAIKSQILLGQRGRKRHPNRQLSITRR